MRINPVFLEFARGATGASPAQRDYLLHLLFQGAALFAWWPKEPLAGALRSGHGPLALVAVCAALGVSLAYYSVRAGAEETRFVGQQSLREWAVSTRLRLTTIVVGYVGGFWLHLCLLVALSMPLVLTASSVGGGTRPVLAWLLAIVLIQASFFRMLAAVVYLAVGRYGVLTFLILRSSFMLIILMPAAVWPPASLLSVSRAVVAGGARAGVDGASMPSHVVFVLLYGVASCLLLVAMWALLWSARRRQVPDEPPMGDKLTVSQLARRRANRLPPSRG